MAFSLKMKNLNFDRIKMSCNYLNYEDAIKIIGSNLSFYPALKSKYEQSCTVELGHSALTIRKQPKPDYCYIPMIEIDSHSLINQDDRNYTLFKLASIAKDVKFNHVEVAIDFEVDENNLIMDFLNSHLLMKRNKKGERTYKGEEGVTDYQGKRLGSKQIKTYLKPEQNCMRMESTYTRRYISREMEHSPLHQLNLSAIILNTFTFKSVNAEYIRKRLNSSVCEKIMLSRKISEKVELLKEHKIDRRYALMKHEYQDVFENEVKKICKQLVLTNASNLNLVSNDNSIAIAN